MKKTNKHLLAFLITTIYLIVVYFLIGICFSTNDDRFINELMSGAITKQPESHLVYINYLLSLPLSLLYHISADISWYGIILVLFHWFSCFCILDSFYTKSKTKTDLFISTILVGILLLTQLYLICQISYTMTAAFMAAAGYVCLLLNHNKKQNIFYYSILELFSFLLRDKAMFMIQPLGLALFIGILIIDKNFSLKTKIYHILKTGVILFSIVVLGFVGNKIGYHSAEWKLYSEYNAARTTLFDYNEFPPYEEVSHILAKYEVSEIDYNAYSHYLILDKELSLDCLKELANYVETLRPSPSLHTLLQDYKNATLYNEYWEINTVLICGYICIFLFLLFSENFYFFIPYTFFFITRTVIWLYLLSEGRFPLRVSMPLMACELILLVSYAFLIHKKQQPFSKWKIFIFVILCSIFGVVNLWSFKIQFISFRKINQSHIVYMDGLNDVLDYCNQNPDNKYILDTMDFIWYNGEVFDGTILGQRNCISAGSWLAGSPSLFNANKKYLSDTSDGFYYIMISESNNTNEELHHPAVLYLSSISESTPKIVDNFSVSHGGIYSVIYFDKKITLK